MDNHFGPGVFIYSLHNTNEKGKGGGAENPLDLEVEFEIFFHAINI